MSAIVFRLNDVPENEAQAVRDLLSENNIEFYETSAGKWGFSVAAIWVKDDTHKDRARELIEAYELRHYDAVHGEYEKLRQLGQHETFSHRLIRNPFLVIVYILLVLVILYLTLIPFISL